MELEKIRLQEEADMRKPYVLHWIEWVKGMALYIDKEVCSCLLAVTFIMEQRKR